MNNSFEKFYLIGKGKFGEQLYFLLKKERFKKNLRFVDDKSNFKIKDFFKIKKKASFNITVGSPKTREKIYNKSLNTRFVYESIIFKNNYINSKLINQGCIIEPNTLITNITSIGIGNFIFSGSIIGHDVCVGNFCNIGCNTVISGNVVIGNRVQIGANSFISNNVKVSCDVLIAPGSTVMTDIKAPGTYKDNIKIK